MASEAESEDEIDSLLERAVETSAGHANRAGTSQPMMNEARGAGKGAAGKGAGKGDAEPEPEPAFESIVSHRCTALGDEYLVKVSEREKACVCVCVCACECVWGAGLKRRSRTH